MPALFPTGAPKARPAGAVACCVGGGDVLYDGANMANVVEERGMPQLRQPVTYDDPPVEAACCSLFGPAPHRPAKTHLTKDFSVELTNLRGQGNLGFTLDVFHNSCVVTGLVQGGAATKWNITADADKQLAKGDCLVAINNVTGSAKDLLDTMSEIQAFPTLETLKLNFVRMHLVEVTLSKITKPLGFGLEPDDEEGVVILQISPDGGAADWNRANPGGVQIKAGDRIVECNGEKMTSQILQMLQEAPTCKMLILSN